MANSTTDDALWDVVRARRQGILATVGAEGFPHLTNVNYLVDDDAREVLLTTTTTRVKGRNLLRDPHVAVHVPTDDWFRFAVVEGTAIAAVAEEPGDAATDALHHIFSTFRGPQERPAFDEKMVAKRRMSVRVPVGRIYGLIPPPATAGEEAS